MKHNFACPQAGCCFVGTQEQTEIHQREEHPEPSADDGYEDFGDVMPEIERYRNQ
jgi:hypothetical protein